MFRKILATLFILVLFIYAEETQIIADRDNTILSESGSLSNALGNLFVGRTNNGSLRRALVHFDIVELIPAGATIESVTISLTVTKTRAGTDTLSIHTLHSDWGEGTSAGSGGGGNATSGDATWTFSFFDSTNWVNPGGDYNPTADLNSSIGENGTYIFGSNDDLVTTVQNWLDNPASNFGWIIIGNEQTNQSAKSIDSREGSVKPTLNVTYSTTTAITGSEANLVDQFVLSKNYPNPFNPSTKIDVTVPSTNNQNFTLQVFNITGQLVKTIHTGLLPPANYTFEWDGKNLKGSQVSSGVYFYKLAGQNMQIMKKMILLK